VKVEFVVSEIEKSYPEIEDFTVMVVEDWDKVESDNFVEYGALSVEVEDDDKEVNILTNQMSSDKPGADQPLKIKSFLHRLRALMPRCSDYSIYSASSRVSDGEHWVRLDVPLVAVGLNREGHTFGLIQQGKKTKNA